MTRTIITIAFLLLLFPYSIQAQNAYTWEDFVERMAIDDADSEGLDNILLDRKSVV